MTVSIAMCTYNGARFLKEQLDSIAAQTLLPAELIICDDGSTDGTFEIIENFKKRVPFTVLLFRNATRLGVTRNFRQAISLCKGDYVALSDQDDLWFPNKLEKQIDFLESNSRLQVVFSDLLLVDASSNSLNQTLWQLYKFNDKRKQQWRNGQGFYLMVRNGNVVIGSTLVFRAGYWHRFQDALLNEYKEWMHDGIIGAIAANDQCIDFIDEPLVRYRQHDSQVTIPYHERKYINLLERYKILLHDFSQMGIDKTRLAYLDNMVRHLSFREHLRGSLINRLPRVAAEWGTGRYFRYSRSIGKAALTDLVK